MQLLYWNIVKKGRRVKRHTYAWLSVLLAGCLQSGVATLCLT